jgi:signal transduction histidine kinase
MRRLLPRSLAAQMLLLLGSALLVAQLVNFALILNERQKLSLAQNEAPAINRFVEVAADLTTAVPTLRKALLTDMSHRGARFALADASGVDEEQRDADLERRLIAALVSRNITPKAALAGVQEETVGDDPRSLTAPGPRRLMLFALEQDDGRWLTGRVPIPPREQWLSLRLAAGTLVLYVIVLGASGWAALRIARPLRELTNAASAFGGRETPSEVTPAGPEDLRNAIEAFNAMNRRVVALLDDKDRMLGALGHDLRTPLAALRIRVECLDPSEDRDAAVAKIAELADMLEEILILARSGRARESTKRLDVAALVEILVEEQRDLGRDVAMASFARVDADVQPQSLNRAVRNLIDNAVKYGGNARVSVVPSADRIEIRVADDGPGIPAEERERVLEPFYRAESSRNRESGGAGLGLAIARNVAESHGGTLRLELSSPDGTGMVAILSISA